MSLLGHIRTVLLVSLISAAVWVFAEAETLRATSVSATLLLRPAAASGAPGEGASILTLVATREQVPDDDGIETLAESRRPAMAGAGVAGNGVLLPASDPSQALQVAGTSAISVQLALRGTAQSVERVQRDLRDALDLVLGASADLPRAEGEIEIDVAQTLMRLPVLTDSGVVILRATPAAVIVKHEQFVTRDVPIVVQASGIDLQGMPLVKPTIARVTMPRSDAEALPFAPQARVMLAPRDVEGFVPGQQRSVGQLAVQAPQEVAGRAFVSVEPKVAEVSVTIRSQLAEFVLQDVPVQVRLLPADMERFDVRLLAQHRTIASVRVVGPASQIAALQERLTWQPLVGTLSFSTADLEARVVSKEVSFADGATGLRFEPSMVSVPVQIVAR